MHVSLADRPERLRHPVAVETDLPDRERPTAVFAANDLLAIGLLQGFVTHGLRVPEDVALIGYDDISFAAAAAVPLSSVRQPRPPPRGCRRPVA